MQAGGPEVGINAGGCAPGVQGLTLTHVSHLCEGGRRRVGTQGPSLFGLVRRSCTPVIRASHGLQHVVLSSPGKPAHSIRARSETCRREHPTCLPGTRTRPDPCRMQKLCQKQSQTAYVHPWQSPVPCARVRPSSRAGRRGGQATFPRALGCRRPVTHPQRGGPGFGQGQGMLGNGQRLTQAGSDQRGVWMTHLP